VEGQAALERYEVIVEELLLGVEALDFLEREGLPVLKSAFAANPDQAASAASRIGFPVALKISSPDVIHKTDTGGVKVRLNREDEVREAFGAIVDRFASQNKGMRIDGVMVQGMGAGFELIVGTLRDAQFGPVLMFGLGGIFAEAMNDVSFRLIPLEPRDAGEMIRDVQGYGVLENPRGETIDLAGIASFLLKVSTLMVGHGEIQEMDLNPVFVSSTGVEICDARLKITRP
jgi:acetyl-CoA synthetase (ADP-forming)